MDRDTESRGKRLRVQPVSFSIRNCVNFVKNDWKKVIFETGKIFPTTMSPENRTWPALCGSCSPGGPQRAGPPGSKPPAERGWFAGHPRGAGDCREPADRWPVPGHFFQFFWRRPASPSDHPKRAGGPVFFIFFYFFCFFVFVFFNCIFWCFNYFYLHSLFLFNFVNYVVFIIKYSCLNNFDNVVVIVII